MGGILGVVFSNYVKAVGAAAAANANITVSTYPSIVSSNVLFNFKMDAIPNFGGYGTTAEYIADDSDYKWANVMFGFSNGSGHTYLKQTRGGPYKDSVYYLDSSGVSNGYECIGTLLGNGTYSPYANVHNATIGTSSNSWALEFNVFINNLPAYNSQTGIYPYYSGLNNVLIRQNPSDNVSYVATVSYGDTANAGSGTTGPVINLPDLKGESWKHVVVQAQRNSPNTHTIWAFVDGVLQNPGGNVYKVYSSSLSTLFSDSVGGTNIGRGLGGAGTYLAHRLDNIRLINGIGNVAIFPISGFPVPDNAAYTAPTSYYSNTLIVDITGRVANTYVTNVFQSNLHPRGNLTNSLWFNKNSNSLIISSPSLQYTGNINIEMWVYPTAYKDMILCTLEGKSPARAPAGYPNVNALIVRLTLPSSVGYTSNLDSAYRISNTAMVLSIIVSNCAYATGSFFTPSSGFQANITLNTWNKITLTYCSTQPGFTTSSITGYVGNIITVNNQDLNNYGLARANTFSNIYISGGDTSEDLLARNARYQKFEGYISDILISNGQPVYNNFYDYTASSNPNKPVNETDLFNVKANTLVYISAAPGIIASNIQYLVLAGGGGGGSGGGGGGGSGGLLEGNLIITSNTTYTITVGSGGSAATPSAVATNGGNTTFIGGSLSFIAVGGGGGGGQPLSRSTGLAGGGGGGSNNNNPGGAGFGYPGIARVTQQGFPGGAGYSNPVAPFNSGGGGGGGTQSYIIPLDAFPSTSSPSGGNGGPGNVSSISGYITTYGGGGGGGATNSIGSSGGGRGGSSGNAPPFGATPGGSGETNGGGGGGGGGGGTSPNPSNGTSGGAGGSGIVILSHPQTYIRGTATGSNVTTGISPSGQVVYTFYTSGTISF
jgi:hypothetical protein